LGLDVVQLTVYEHVVPRSASARTAQHEQGVHVVRRGQRLGDGDHVVVGVAKDTIAVEVLSARRIHRYQVAVEHARILVLEVDKRVDRRRRPAGDTADHGYAALFQIPVQLVVGVLVYVVPGDKLHLSGSGAGRPVTSTVNAEFREYVKEAVDVERSVAKVGNRCLARYLGRTHFKLILRPTVTALQGQRDDLGVPRARL